jgi:hypothetical protein
MASILLATARKVRCVLYFPIFGLVICAGSCISRLRVFFSFIVAYIATDQNVRRLCTASPTPNLTYPREASEAGEYPVFSSASHHIVVRFPFFFFSSNHCFFPLVGAAKRARKEKEKKERPDWLPVGMETWPSETCMADVRLARGKKRRSLSCFLFLFFLSFFFFFSLYLSLSLFFYFYYRFLVLSCIISCIVWSTQDSSQESEDGTADKRRKRFENFKIVWAGKQCRCPLRMRIYTPTACNFH